MGAGNIPLPALAIQPPQQQPNQAENYMRLSALLGQQRLQQQQIQGATQENQMRQMQLQDMQTIQKIAPQYIQKDASGRPTGYDYDGLTNGAIAAGVRPQSLAPLQTMRKTAADTLLAKSGADKNVIANQDALNKQGFEKVEAIKGISDPTQRQSEYASALQWAQQNKVDVSRFPQQVPNNDALSGLETSFAMHSQALSDAKEAGQGQQAQTAAALNQNKLDIIRQYNQNPSLLTDQVNAAAPAAKYPDLNRRTTFAVQQAMRTGDVDGAKAAIAKASEEVGGIEKETNPAVQAAKLHLSIAQKSAEQAITDGDPRAAAQLLVSGTVAPSQLVSSRKPAFAQQAFTAAAQLQPGWTATKADADYKVASSPQQVAFFGSAKSLTDKGGTLDQLADAAKDIPSNQLPVFNTVADALRASTGSGPIAKYAAISLGVADDYAKVMGGGQGSDTSRTQALNLISAKQSPAQRAASIEGIRGSVTSQTNSRIGKNPVLRKMYGDELQSGGSSFGRSSAQQLTGKAAKWGIAPVGAQ